MDASGCAAHRSSRLTPFAVPEAGDVDRRCRRPGGRSFAAERAEHGAQRLRRRASSHVDDAGRRPASASSSRCGARARATAWPGAGRPRPAQRLKRRVAGRGRGAAKPRGGARRARPRSGFETADARRHRRAGHPRRPAGAAAPSGASAPPNFIAEATSAGRGRPRRPRRPRHRPLQRAEDDRGGRRAARLPGDPLCRRRPAVTCRSRTSSCCRATAPRTTERRARQARRRRLAGAQGRLKKRIREMADAADPDRRRARSCARRRCSTPPDGALRRVRRALPLRGDRGPADRDRRRPRRSRGRPADGPADLRRRRLRQDRGGAARRLRRGDGRQAGRGRGADDAAGAPALQDLHRALRRPAGQRRPGLAAVSAPKELAEAKKGLADGTIDIVVGTHALLGKAIKFKDLGLLDRRRGAAFRRQAQGAAEGAAAPTSTC